VTSDRILPGSIYENGTILFNLYWAGNTDYSISYAVLYLFSPADIIEFQTTHYSLYGKFDDRNIYT